jgi:hypothetical protein
MPAAKRTATTARSASRGRSSPNGSGSRAKTRSNNRASSGGQTRKPQTRTGSGTKSKARNGSSTKSQGRNGSGGQSRPNTSRSRTSNGSLKTVGLSAVSATVGVAGGLLLGRSALQRNRKLLGVSVPNKIDLSGVGQSLSGVGHQIGEAGRQFGKLAGEVRAVREKAEEIGKALH